MLPVSKLKRCTTTAVQFFDAVWILNNKLSFKLSFFCHGSTALVGLSLPYEVSCSTSDTLHSVALFWKSVPLPDNTKDSQLTDVHARGGIRNCNHTTRAAADPRAATGIGFTLGKSNLIIPYPTAFPYGNGMVLHFYQQQESSTTKTVHKVINRGIKTYV